MNNHDSAHQLTDEQLLRDVKAAAARERRATTDLIALLAEIDARKLYLGEGYSSLFVYCTQCLHLSEHAAYGRIEAARVARRYPVVLPWLEEGSLTLTVITLLAAHLTPENHLAVLQAARRKSKRDVELQVAAMRPLPAVPSVVRKLPQPAAQQRAGIASAGANELPPAPAGNSTGLDVPPRPGRPSALPVVQPLAPERYKVQITIGRETYDKLRKIQNLLRHVVPDGDPAAIFDRALNLLLSDLERKKLAQVERPRRSSSTRDDTRHVPAAARRVVWARDDGRCAFVGRDGRCAERRFLEFHHVIPFAEGGATTADNLQLRCRAHNAYEAVQHSGLPLLRERPVEYSTRSGPSRQIPRSQAARRGYV